MRVYLRVFGLCLGLASAASAADIGRLEWGNFTVEADTSDGMLDWKSEISDDGHGLRMTFDSLAAEANGAVREARSAFAGHFDVLQPSYDTIATLHVELQGVVIKSGDTSTRLVLRVGTAEQIFEWPGTAAEKFSKTIDIEVPGGKRLPVPFPISAEITASKSGQSGAAYLSLQSLNVKAGSPRVAAK